MEEPLLRASCCATTPPSSSRCYSWFSSPSSLVERSHLALALAAALFGGLNVVLEVGLRPGSQDGVYTKVGRASVFALYRDVGAAVMLFGASRIWASAQWRQPEAWVWRTPRLAWMVFACGFFGIYAQLAFIVGLALTSGNLAALFQPTAPIATVLFGVLVGAERASWAKALAIALGLGGAVRSRDLLRLEQWIGDGYAQSTPEELQFLIEVGRATGVVLDRVYSGKAALGMVADLKARPVARAVFIHTGGLLGLYAQEQALAPLIGDWRGEL